MQTSAESKEIIRVSIFAVHHPTFEEAFMKQILLYFYILPRISSQP